MQVLNATALRAWPLPSIGRVSDKEDRGSVVVIAGSREIPGAAVLAATAALRAGAGKLTIATSACIAPQLGLMVPEARVIGLAEHADGGFLAKGAGQLENLAHSASAVLIGPGLAEGPEHAEFIARTLQIFSVKPLVLDALAMDQVSSSVISSASVLLTPHAGEMAHLSGKSKPDVQRTPLETAQHLVARCPAQNTVVALKGATTYIASRTGASWKHVSINPGLGTSGSGDVLAGIMAGLAARGAVLEQAAIWGVAVHAMAGQMLGRKTGPVGYLARHLADEVPCILQSLAS